MNKKKTTYEMAKYYDVLGKKLMPKIMGWAISLKILLMLYASTQLLERKIILEDSDVGKFGHIEKYSMMLRLKWEIIPLIVVTEEYTWTTIVGKIIECVL